jgi:hypothetical protein
VAVLRDAAIREGSWTEKRQAKQGADINVRMERLTAGRKQVADAKAARGCSGNDQRLLQDDLSGGCEARKPATHWRRCRHPG